jgi:hypothetical protein
MPDPELVLSGRRTVLRVTDLLELAQLVTRLGNCTAPAVTVVSRIAPRV